MIITCQTCSREVEYNNGKSGHSLTKFGSASWERIREELDKCVLYCANCHLEYHWYEENKDVHTSIERPSGVVG